MGRAKTIVHVNQHRIKANAKRGTDDPVITIKSRKANRYAHEAVVLDADGRELLRVVYRPEKPLSCGARVWIEVPGGLTVKAIRRTRRPQPRARAVRAG